MSAESFGRPPEEILTVLKGMPVEMYHFMSQFYEGLREGNYVPFTLATVQLDACMLRLYKTIAQHYIDIGRMPPDLQRFLGDPVRWTFDELMSELEQPSWQMTKFLVQLRRLASDDMYVVN